MEILFIISKSLGKLPIIYKMNYKPLKFFFNLRKVQNCTLEETVLIPASAEEEFSTFPRDGKARAERAELPPTRPLRAKGGRRRGRGTGR